MSVYVDDFFVPFGRMRMSHMIADTSAELDAMASIIGVSARWKQYPGTWKEHFDVCQSKRELAIRYGAEEVSKRELGMMLIRRRSGKPLTD